MDEQVDILSQRPPFEPNFGVSMVIIQFHGFCRFYESTLTSSSSSSSRTFLSSHPWLSNQGNFGSRWPLCRHSPEPGLSSAQVHHCATPDPLPVYNVRNIVGSLPHEAILPFEHRRRPRTCGRQGPQGRRFPSTQTIAAPSQAQVSSQLRRAYQAPRR